MNTKFSRFAAANLVVLLGFTVYFLARRNFEFLVYAVSLSLLVFIIEKTDRIFRYGKAAKAGFTVWLLLHLLGGTLYLKGVRLYDMMLIPIAGEPYNILRYDQVIHAFCYFVMTFFLDAVVMYLGRRDAPKFTLGLITGLAALGLSAVNEIIEFGAVVFFHSSGVGGYYNNALDLVFNLLGILVALGVLWRGRRAGP